MSAPAVAAGAILTDDEAGTILRALGFRADTTGSLRQAVEVFQDTWRLGAALKRDGKVGKFTTKALSEAEKRRRAGLTTMSAHFSHHEFACRCKLTAPTCRGVVVAGALVDALEALHARYYPHGMVIASGYRCPAHNAATPGAVDESQHQNGTAADITRVVLSDKVEELALFSGIGRGAVTNLVRHVDVRHIDRDFNHSGSTVRHPAKWTYAGC